MTSAIPVLTSPFAWMSIPFRHPRPYIPVLTSPSLHPQRTLQEQRSCTRRCNRNPLSSGNSYQHHVRSSALHQHYVRSTLPPYWINCARTRVLDCFVRKTRRNVLALAGEMSVSDKTLLTMTGEGCAARGNDRLAAGMMTADPTWPCCNRRCPTP